jgi:two-component system, cell cycle sensor histidine kinase and response regulator CckA
MIEGLRATVLVLEDDPGTAKLQTRVLQRQGHRVLTAETAQQARELVHENQVDIILLDQKLTDDTCGLEFYEELKTEGIDLPTILITGFSSESLVVQAMRAGVRDFVAKSPEYLDYLPNAVEQVLRRGQLERRLIESEELHRITLESVSDTVLITDERGDFVYVCPNVDHIFSYNVEEAKQLGNVRALLGRDLCTGEELDRAGEITNVEIESKDKLGNQHILLANVKRVAIAGGTRLYTCRDVTDRRQAEEELKREREYSAQIIDAAPVMIRVLDRDGITRFVNPAVTRVTGYEPEELLGANWWELLYPGEEYAQVERILPQIMSGEVHTYQLTLTTKEGEKRTIAWTSVCRFDEQGEIASVIGIGNDVTERNRLEEHLHQSQRLESIGRMVGGIAHDFNNLLTVVLGNGEFALDQVGSADPVAEPLRDIVEAANRAAALTNQLLAFGRRQVLSPRAIHVNELIESVHRFMRRVIGEDVDLVLRLDPEVFPIYADPVQMEQILLNLVLNARDAMPEGGRLTIQTRNVELDESYTSLHDGLNPGGYVQIAVADTGTGMTPEVRERLFEPFFTTKPTGKGSGMGLATVFGIVKQSEGHIAVYSEPGHGSTFKVYLPQSPEIVLTDPPDDASSEETWIAQTVLLVEDDDALRKLTRRMLDDLGYQVFEAANGAEAIELSRQLPHALDILLTDMVMPQLGGRELAQQIQLERPATKVLYMSGYTDDTVLRHGLSDTTTAFLSKPFTRKDLRQKLRALFD